MAAEQKLESLKSKIKDLTSVVRHQRAIGSALLWYLKGWELKYSSDVLYRSRLRSKKRSFSVRSQELLLLGFAFELLFKSFFLANNKVIKIPKKMKTHSLEKLSAQLGGLNLSSDSRRLLKKLSIIVWWQGRYPCALEPNHNVPVEISDAEIHELRVIWKKCCQRMPDAIGLELFQTINSIKAKRR